MKHQFLSVTFFIVASCLYAQEVFRIEVSGKLVGTSDVEGVTIFNTSSNKGIVADKQGYFLLEVALNDILEISALQYELKTVRVNQEVISSKKMLLFLVDKVNTLNEVLLLPSQLSGNIFVDIENAEKLKNMEINFGNLSDLEFPEDEFTKVDNELVKQGQLKNGLNVASILGLNKLINRPIKNRSLPEEELDLETILAKKYSPEFFNSHYQIPLNRVDDFISFVVLNGLTKELLQADEEFMLLEFLQKQRLEFKKQEDEKN